MLENILQGEKSRRDTRSVDAEVRDRTDNNLTLQNLIDNTGRKRQVLVGMARSRQQRIRRLNQLSSALVLLSSGTMLAASLGVSNPATQGLVAIVNSFCGLLMLVTIKYVDDKKMQLAYDAAAKLQTLNDQARLESAQRDLMPEQARRNLAGLVSQYRETSRICDQLVPEPVSRSVKPSAFGRVLRWGVRPASRSNAPSHQRRHDRIVPREVQTVITFANGAQKRVRIIDVSQSGASLAAPLAPPAGAELKVGRTEARVVRAHKDGFAVEFLHALPARLVNQDLIL